jgi:hypothetical protein
MRDATSSGNLPVSECEGIVHAVGARNAVECRKRVLPTGADYTAEYRINALP